MADQVAEKLDAASIASSASDPSAAASGGQAKKARASVLLDVSGVCACEASLTHQSTTCPGPAGSRSRQGRARCAARDQAGKGGGGRPAHSPLWGLPARAVSGGAATLSEPFSFSSSSYRIGCEGAVGNGADYAWQRHIQVPAAQSALAWVWQAKLMCGIEA